MADENNTPTYAWKLKGNLKGPKGDPGDKGETGAPGAAGKSMRVANVDIMSNSDVALSAITPAAGIAVDDVIIDNAGDAYTVASVAADKVHVSNAIADYSLKGPKGDPGEKGADGKGITIAGSVATKADLPTDLTAADAGKAYLAQDTGLLYIWDGTAFPAEGVQFKGDKGDKGETGPAGVDSATVVTLDPGKAPTVSLAKGVLALGIPAGAKGDKGDPGAKGADGKDGAAGARGNTITNGTAAPTDGTGRIPGDVYVDTATWNFYAYEAA